MSVRSLVKRLEAANSLLPDEKGRQTIPRGQQPWCITFVDGPDHSYSDLISHAPTDLRLLWKVAVEAEFVIASDPLAWHGSGLKKALDAFEAAP